MGLSGGKTPFRPTQRHGALRIRVRTLLLPAFYAAAVVRLGVHLVRLSWQILGASRSNLSRRAGIFPPDHKFMNGIFVSHRTCQKGETRNHSCVHAFAIVSIWFNLFDFARRCPW